MRFSAGLVEKVKCISLEKVLIDLNIQKLGHHFRCINPAHEDKTPSLYINQTENHFHCFGCSMSGDVINVYELVYSLDFKNAVLKLALDYNIFQNSNENTSKKRIYQNKYKFLCKYDEYLYDERAAVYEFSGNKNTETAELLSMNYVRKERLERNKAIFLESYNFCKSMYKNGINDKVFYYLTEVRKLSSEVILENKIFSLCEGIDNHLKKKFDINELKGSGLFHKGNLFFRDTHPLIIPYIECGDIVYLRARQFPSTFENKNSMKYIGLKNDSINLNSIKRFYNYDVLNELVPGSRLFITEGEIDNLMLQSIGFNSIAIPGINGFPEDKIGSLLQYDIILCFDNDDAGKKLTNKITRLFCQLGKQISVINLPENVKDVSEYFLLKLNLHEDATN